MESQCWKYYYSFILEIFSTNNPEIPYFCIGSPTNQQELWGRKTGCGKGQRPASCLGIFERILQKLSWQAEEVNNHNTKIIHSSGQKISKKWKKAIG